MIKVQHLIEGVLTYLNALLILDLAREVFKNNIHIAVVIVAIVTLLIVFLYNARKTTGQPNLPIMFPLSVPSKSAQRTYST